MIDEEAIKRLKEKMENWEKLRRRLEALQILENRFGPTDGSPLWATSSGTWTYTGCSHDWKRYEGFTARYEYCSKCDKKKDI